MKFPYKILNIREFGELRPHVIDINIEIFI